MTQFQHNAPEPSSDSQGALQLFNVSGADIRFGLTGDGTPYAVAADFAKTMGYGQASDATRLLDDDEKGQQIVLTPGGRQMMNVIYEDGLWELIFRSTLPGAKAIKSRVKSILKEIRETGHYDATAAPVPQDYEEALVHLLDKVRENKALEAANKVLAPKAGKWDQFMNSEGLIGMTAIADMLDTPVRDMTNWLVDEGVFRKQPSRFGSNKNMPRRMYQASGHFEVKLETNGKVSYEVAYATVQGADFVFDRWQAHAAA
ncbi:phage antirepressor KilAC domain-containing protein [Streptomyces adelaidensis]|uniref:phage antirepressor KilAC domain-containing protein n=1 Tax=Streptomyces adelaidensis TaxID=2796465 RepID=UPI0019083FF5|nr:phage antirepressor KilAC domain-containing protein [Streptomyces adelaidensis]